MPDYEFDIQFNYGPGDVTIRFYDKRLAKAYFDTTGPKCQLSNDGHLIKLPPLAYLDYIRSSDHTHDLIFVFVDEEAAKDWKRDLALVSRDGKDVRIKRKWKAGQLDAALGVRRNNVMKSFEGGKGRDADIDRARVSHH